MRTLYGFSYWRTISHEMDDQVYLPLDFGSGPLKMVQFEGKSTGRRCDCNHIIGTCVELFADDVTQAEMVFNMLFKIHVSPILVFLRRELGAASVSIVRILHVPFMHEGY